MHNRKLLLLNGMLVVITLVISAISLISQPVVSVSAGEGLFPWMDFSYDRVATDLSFVVVNRSGRDVAFRLTAEVPGNDDSLPVKVRDRLDEEEPIFVKAGERYYGFATVTIKGFDPSNISRLKKPRLICNIDDNELLRYRFVSDRLGLLKKTTIEAQSLVKSDQPAGVHKDYDYYDMTFRVTNNTNRPITRLALQAQTSLFAAENDHLFADGFVLQPGETATGSLKVKLLVSPDYFSEHTITLYCTAESKLPGHIICYRKIPVKLQFKQESD